MTTTLTEGQTFILRGTGPITIERIYPNRWGETHAFCRGNGTWFALPVEDVSRLIEKLGA